MDADDDDNFVDLTGLHSPWRYRDPERLRVEEERDMLRLDEEWIRVTVAYDVLRSTGDIHQVDESELYAQTYGNAGRNGASRFWSMLQSTRKIISNLEEISAWDVLLKRRQLRRGLQESTVNDELATVMLHSDMEMWNLSQVESFFLAQAHPDWEKWDMIGSVCAVPVEEATALEIRNQIIGTPLEEPFTLEVIHAMRDRLDMWRIEDVRTSSGVLEAALVKSYWRKEEVWRAYQICNFRTRILADYRDALALHDCQRIQVSDCSHC
jgi:hypothetical protein